MPLELDTTVLSYSHLKNYSREQEALHALRKVASLVKPIMRARHWKVGELTEFWPDEKNLLGLNVNRGQKILLRLRHAGDQNQFLPIEQVTDTMLHELAHIIHGPHDDKFHALWNQLRDEYQGLIMKGYTGEGFLSKGRKLGGRRIPMHEARRLARIEAEKLRARHANSGQRLGGAVPTPGSDIRRVIVGAVERRLTALCGCGNNDRSEQQIRVISDTASKNGFRTQAEEDAANEAAIAQALWELVQEDEKAKYGESYIPPSAENPVGKGGGSIWAGQSSSTSASRPPPLQQGPLLPPRPTDSQQPRYRTNKSPTSSRLTKAAPSSSSRSNAPARDAGGMTTVPSMAAAGWTCEKCTLINETTHLCCDACGVKRPRAVTQQLTVQSAARRPPQVIDLTASPPRPPAGSQARALSGSSSSAPASKRPAYWMCTWCTTKMERQWWTCSTCGKMKEDSW